MLPPAAPFAALLLEQAHVEGAVVFELGVMGLDAEGRDEPKTGLGMRADAHGPGFGA